MKYNEAVKIAATLLSVRQIACLVTDPRADKTLARIKSVFTEALEGAKNGEQGAREESILKADNESG